MSLHGLDAWKTTEPPSPYTWVECDACEGTGEVVTSLGIRDCGPCRGRGEVEVEVGFEPDWADEAARRRWAS